MDFKQLQKIANTIRGLSMDAIEAANSGHPGLPLGCAEIGAYLYGKHLNHNPKNPSWLNRDRFILSAGHGSMLLYSCLHLAGFDISLDDLKRFRQLHSPTAGHPEYNEIPGIETTTGPLGQGIATGIGMALGNKIIESRFNLEKTNLLTSKVYILAGDGCMMEGISSEACSFAGHLNLNNVVLIYDSNDICLDGPLEECFSEDVEQRFKSYGWNVKTIDGHSFTDIESSLSENSSKPLLIIAKTKIGFGSPNLEGSSEVHGKAMGESEVRLTKEKLGISTKESFYIDPKVKEFFELKLNDQNNNETQWNLKFNEWLSQNPEKAEEWNNFTTINVNNLKDELLTLSLDKPMASRASSNKIIQILPHIIPNIYGGSADLSCSDSTYIKDHDFITKKSYLPRNIKYGVREFAMAAIASGLSLHGMILPFVGTFLTFSDYMRNAIRLASLMNLKVIYQFTHDSIFLGEDGPTHQPVEHLASLRCIPNLRVIRPGDSNEVKSAWYTALTENGPTALILSRQSLPIVPGSSFEKSSKGAYIVSKEKQDSIDYCILTTGSELNLAYQVTQNLEAYGKSVRLVSIPSFEIFDIQSQEYQNSVIEGDISKYCVIEAQTSFGWHKYTGKNLISFTIESFGKSAPGKDLADYYGFTKESIVKKLLESEKVTV
ncbi:transketolase [Candidatus Marinamargulisbacteria bacterium SCGC AG-410-N11]|nr:transketolase [Candidatus Marinamargulisbacteria bacterium SCGC AG-410-N11]